jgi:hypothetical protein
MATLFFETSRYDYLARQGHIPEENNSQLRRYENKSIMEVTTRNTVFVLFRLITLFLIFRTEECLLLIEKAMPLAVSYKVATQPKMNSTKQRVSASL